MKGSLGKSTSSANDEILMSLSSDKSSGSANLVATSAQVLDGPLKFSFVLNHTLIDYGHRYFAQIIAVVIQPGANNRHALLAYARRTLEDTTIQAGHLLGANDRFGKQNAQSILLPCRQVKPVLVGFTRSLTVIHFGHGVQNLPVLQHCCGADKFISQTRRNPPHPQRINRDMDIFLRNKAYTCA